jgi:hypothetical protein
MQTFNQNMRAYKTQLALGKIQKAYAGLMEYFRYLRVYFKDQYPDHFVSSNIYYGYMDMTYFSFSSAPLKNRKLKSAIVFVHETCQFEMWLAGVNRDVQKQYCKLIRESDWKKYHIGSTDKGVDYIVNHILLAAPDFSDLDALTKQIEVGALAFIHEIEKFIIDQNIAED